MQYYLNIATSGYKNTMAALKTDINILVFKPEVDIMNNLYTKMGNEARMVWRSQCDDFFIHYNHNHIVESF